MWKLIGLQVLIHFFCPFSKVLWDLRQDHARTKTNLNICVNDDLKLLLTHFLRRWRILPRQICHLALSCSMQRCFWHANIISLACEPYLGHKSGKYKRHPCERSWAFFRQSLCTWNSKGLYWPHAKFANGLRTFWFHVHFLELCPTVISEKSPCTIKSNESPSYSFIDIARFFDVFENDFAFNCRQSIFRRLVYPHLALISF